MTSLHLKDYYAFSFAFLALVSVVLLQIDIDRFLGVLLIIWSIVGLERIFRISESSSLKEQGSTKNIKPVARLLSGVHYKCHHEIREISRICLKTPLWFLALGGAVLGGELLLSNDPFLLQHIAFILLAGLVFWSVQAASTESETAKYLLVFLGFLALGLFITHSYSVPGENIGSEYSVFWGPLIIGSTIVCVFLWSLNRRHRNHYFALLGLTVLGFICALSFYSFFEAYALLFCLWGILGVCWAQAWPHSERKYYLYK